MWGSNSQCQIQEPQAPLTKPARRPPTSIFKGSEIVSHVQGRRAQIQKINKKNVAILSN